MIIAECATNHGGDPEWQERLIVMAAEAGADCAKFQSYQTRHLSPDDPQFAWLQKSELSDADHDRLLRVCNTNGIKFLTTVFHEDRVKFLASLGLDAIKIGSGEAGNPEVLKEVAKYSWEVYLSTGLVTRTELERANRMLSHRTVTLMHTVSEYPTPNEKANLGRMAWLKDRFNRAVGYSDHTTDVDAAASALALGATAVEVHMSDPDAPRFRPWDKRAHEVAGLVEYAERLRDLTKPGRMLWDETEPRPFVGRWHAR